MVLFGGAVAGIAAAMPKLGERPLAFELAVLFGGAIGGMLFGYLVGRAFGWI